MRWLVLAALVASCKQAEPIEPGQCLRLPGAVRTDLVADPAGGGLFWLEPVDDHDFDSNARRSANLVRYDVERDKVDLVLDHVGSPLHFLRDKIVALRTVGAKTLVLIERDGHAQTLLPSYLQAVDVELVDDHTIAVLADGDGPRAVYTIDLDRPRPHHLIDADVLLSTSSGRVFVVADNKGLSIELATGKREPVDLPKDHAHPQGEDSWYVDNAKVRVRPMRAGKDRVVVSRRGNWKLVEQVGAVLARTAPGEARSDAFVLSSGVSRALPTIVGGASILGATNLDGKSWALIGHNTSNYLGDLGEIAAETDVCMLPAAGEVRFPMRLVPMRFAARSIALFGAAHEVAPTAIVQFLDGVDAPMTVSYTVKEDGGTDLAAMRARARELHRRVTSVLGDREIRTEVVFADERFAVMRWRRERLGDRAVAGMGDVLLSDPAEYDAEVRDLVDVTQGDKIHCEGTLANMQPRWLKNLAVRCIAGDRATVIAIPELAPMATHAFSETWDADPGDTPFFEVVAGREPLSVRDARAEAKLQRILELAERVYTDTQLSLQTHVTKDAFTVTVRATTELETQPEETRLLRVSTAYRLYQGLRDLEPIDPALSLVLHVDVLDNAYEYDGTQLTRL